MLKDWSDHADLPFESKVWIHMVFLAFSPILMF
jgi:hypothetical protein